MDVGNAFATLTRVAMRATNVVNSARIAVNDMVGVCRKATNVVMMIVPSPRDEGVSSERAMTTDGNVDEKAKPFRAGLLSPDDIRLCSLCCILLEGVQYRVAMW